jgi:hypothetical protein
LGHPLVYRAGSFAVARGADRRETGTHYTPRSLTETIVEKTLEPIVYEGQAEGRPREQWRLKSPAELLDLKICDPAMGSGAFLVQACRYLSERLVEAWAREEDAGRFVTVDGAVIESADDNEPLPKTVDDRLLIARRLVAERCLFGVDLNPLAVELAKLSIWLVTMAKGRPFAFLDHNLRCGDSLLGIHRLDQLTKLTMNPDQPGHQQRLFGRNIEDAVRQAIELRTRLRQIRIRDIHDVEAMAHLHGEAREVLGAPSLIADAFIGEALRSCRNAANLAAALDGLAIETEHFIRGDKDAAHLIRAQATDALAVDTPVGRSRRRTFHWPLEFPHVFQRPNAGFDVMIGNPPFLNAIEHADFRDDRIRGYYSISYQPFASGAYDLCLLFWGRVLLHLLGRHARYGLLSPTVLLSATSEWKRWMHATWRPDFFCLNPVDLFTVARIRTTAICGARGRAVHLEIVDRDTRLSADTIRRHWSDPDINWYEVIQRPAKARERPRTLGPTIRLGDLTDIFAGCTTADAYNLKPLIEDCREGRGPQLITTGAIDRYVLKWGKMRIRYLKDDYEYPRWPERTRDRGVARAAARQVGKKILVGGLTAVIEAWLDRRGEAAGVVQTWVIKPKDKAFGRESAWWQVSLGILNSATFSRIFVNRHGAAAMSGKQITVKKESLLEMPVPDLPRATWSASEGVGSHLAIPPASEWSDIKHASLIGAALTRVVSTLIEGAAGDNRFAALDKLAHHFAGALYGLSCGECEEDYQWWCARSGSTVYEHTPDWHTELEALEIMPR